MLYKGTLYAKIAGKYVPVEHNSEYYDRLEADNRRRRCCMNCRRYSRDEIHDSIIEFCGVDDDLPLELFCDKWESRN